MICEIFRFFCAVSIINISTIYSSVRSEANASEFLEDLERNGDGCFVSLTIQYLVHDIITTICIEGIILQNFLAILK